MPFIYICYYENSYPTNFNLMQPTLRPCIGLVGNTIANYLIRSCIIKFALPGFSDIMILIYF